MFAEVQRRLKREAAARREQSVNAVSAPGPATSQRGGASRSPRS